MCKVIILLKNPKTIELLEYKNLLKSYEEKKNHVNIFEDYGNQIGLNDYYSITSYLKVENLSEFDLVTDDSNLLLAWFRIYQNELKNFILLYQGYNKFDFQNYVPNEKEFYTEVLKLNGLSSENIHKKIFINLKSCNYYDTFKNLLKVSHQFELLENYNPNSQPENYNTNKRYYISEKQNVEFVFNNKCFENIKLYIDDFELKRIITSNINEKEFLNIEVIKYLIYYLYKSNGLPALETMIQYIMSVTKKHDIEVLIKSITDSIHSVLDIVFIDKINLLFTILKFTEKKNSIIENIFLLLQNDETQIVTHHNILKNISVLMFRNEIAPKESYYHTIRNHMIKIACNYKKELFELGCKFEIKNYDNKKMVIFIDQLLSLYHAPTRVLISLVEQITNNSDYEIVIIVEENLVPSVEERYNSEGFNANHSYPFKELHMEYFKSNRLKVYYSNPNENKVTRLKKIYDVIEDANPEIIFSLSSFSLMQNIMYGEIPNIYYSFGNEYSPSISNLYLYKNQERAIEIAKQRDVKEVGIIRPFLHDIKFLESKKSIERSHINLKKKDFVVITVGNRLETEIDSNLIEHMLRLIEKYKNIKWLIVSPTLPSYLLENFGELIGKSIIHIQFEKDLLALTKICDVFLNPNRIGGGNSVGVAMKVGIPVLITDFPSDGLFIVGKDNVFGKSYMELMTGIEKCYLDESFKKSFGERLKKRIDLIEDNRSIDQLLSFMEEAKELFFNIIK